MCRLWPNRDPLAELGSRVLQRQRATGRRIALLVDQNLYHAFSNDPISRIDPDGRCVPCIIAVALGIILSGCDNHHHPPPPPKDPDDCWKNSDKYHLPSPGAGKQLACLARKTGCLQCCEDKHPINGGDPKKYEECVEGCEDNYKHCAALNTTTQR